MWTKWETEYVKLTYGILPIEEIAEKIGRSPGAVRNKASTLKKVPRQREYAVYRDDKLIAIGNETKCANILGMSFQTFRWYRTPSYESRREKFEPEDRLYIVDLGFWPVNEEEYHEALEQITKRI